MSKEKSPAFLFYPKDFFMDTVTWHPAEVGVHIRLMCIQYENGPLGQIDFDDLLKTLIDLGVDPSRVRSKYEVNDQGQYYNEKLERMRGQRQEYISKQRENGKKGGRPTKPNESQEKPNGKPKENPTANPVVKPNETQTKPTRVENENKVFKSLREELSIKKELKDIGQIENSTDTDPTPKINKPIFFKTIKVNGNDRVDSKDDSHPFNVFWKEYPRRVKRQDAERSFKRNVTDWETLKVIIVDIQKRLAMGVWEVDRIQYIPHPSTYLNNVQWEDELMPLNTEKQTNSQVRSHVHELPTYSIDDTIDEDVDELRATLKKQLEGGSKAL